MKKVALLAAVLGFVAFAALRKDGVQARRKANAHAEVVGQLRASTMCNQSWLEDAWERAQIDEEVGRAVLETDCARSKYIRKLLHARPGLFVRLLHEDLTRTMDRDIPYLRRDFAVTHEKFGDTRTAEKLTFLMPRVLVRLDRSLFALRSALFFAEYLVPGTDGISAEGIEIAELYSLARRVKHAYRTLDIATDQHVPRPEFYMERKSSALGAPGSVSEVSEMLKKAVTMEPPP